MERDIRGSELYREVEALFGAFYQPGQGRISDADHVAAAPDGARIGFTGSVFDDLASAPRSRVCVVERATGNTTEVSAGIGQHDDRQPCWSPDSTRLAFLSDRATAGSFQLCLTSGDGQGPVHEAPPVDGCIESVSWSPGGRSILLCVAGFGADLAGCQGGATIATSASALPDWVPDVDSGDADNLWRSAWIYDLDSDSVRQLPTDGLNVWEARWCGDDALVAVVGDHHSEGSWYTARLVRIGVADGTTTSLYCPAEQIGLPCATPSGRQVAVIEAVCSDRLILAGDVRVLAASGGDVRTVATNGVDVTWIGWIDESVLAWAGQRDFETVCGTVSIAPPSGQIDAGNRCTEVWAAEDRTIGAWYPSLAPLNDTESGGKGHAFAAIVESYASPPALCEISTNGVSRLVTLVGDEESAGSRPTVCEPIRWAGRDGLEMQGWMVRPEGLKGPAPLVVDIHGGPVWACRNRWRGRLRGAQALANHGVVSLYPNPRGSSARGQAFAAMVRGDMGGEDTYDYLAGIDALVELGIADPDRIGVTGISYGGFMSSWLITQDQRFAAAVPISPVCNWYSQHGTSQIPYFDELFLEGSAREPNGRFFHRSPVMFADRVECPTLILVGALDQNTPPTQGLEFHRALLEKGVESVLVTYPKAGHGIRNFPDVIDHVTRYVGWFLKHL